MHKIILKSLGAASVAMVATFALIFTVIPAMGETIAPSAMVLALVGPFLVGSPITAVIFWQADRAHALNLELAEAHRRLAEAHEQLGEKSRRDHLTGMLNREGFLAAFSDSRRRKEQGVFLIIDADHFKRINDTFGHLTGDEALKLITQAIIASVRGVDIAGRIGGEEFGIFLAGANDEESRIVAERIRHSVEQLVFNPMPGQTLPLTVSIGGTFASPGSTVSELMREADCRLYMAKHSGRNRVILDEAIKIAA